MKLLRSKEGNYYYYETFCRKIGKIQNNYFIGCSWGSYTKIVYNSLKKPSWWNHLFSYFFLAGMYITIALLTVISVIMIFLSSVFSSLSIILEYIANLIVLDAPNLETVAECVLDQWKWR